MIGMGDIGTERAHYEVLPADVPHRPRPEPAETVDDTVGTTAAGTDAAGTTARRDEPAPSR